MEIKRLSEIESNPIKRFMTGFDELDYIYGYSEFGGRLGDMWGMPANKISLWAGTTGVGKSRVTIEVVKNMSKIYPHCKILYFQTEADISDFAGWVKDSSNYDNIYCCGESNIEKMIEAMYEVEPNVIVIDSINEVDEFESGSKKEARRVIGGVTDEHGVMIKPGLRQVCHDLYCHIIILGQKNQNGTIKGGTSLPHLVDVALDLVSYGDEKSKFIIRVGEKHRHGKRESSGIWEHNRDGVKCVSENRLYDKKWCSSKKVRLQSREQEIRDYVDNMPDDRESVKPVKRSFLSFFKGKQDKEFVRSYVKPYVEQPIDMTGIDLDKGRSGGIDLDR